MRKILSILAVVVLAISFGAGCAAPATTQAETTQPATTVPQATPPTTAEPLPVSEPAAEPETTQEETAPFEVTITPVITQPQTQVTVTTPDQFLAAIAPNTEIIVDTELLDLSLATGYGTGSGKYYLWEEAFDGPQLIITDVSNLTIRGAGNDRTAVVISATPRYAYVLTFRNCSNIMVTGFTAGHTKEPGSCAGGVICFWNSQDILVENCGLFGCGTLGVMGMSSIRMQIVNNEIYECSVGGVEFTNCDLVNVDGNTFRDLGGPIFRIYDCGSITCNGKDAIPFQ